MSRVSFQYLTVNRRRHPAILSYRWEEMNDVVTVFLGASFCHNKDRFNRALGRQIAEGRMNSRPQIFRFSRNDLPFHIQIVEEVRSYFSDFNDRRVTRYINNQPNRNDDDDSPPIYSIIGDGQGQVHTVTFGTNLNRIGEAFDNSWCF